MAFVPPKPTFDTPGTVMHFKFLKDMGMEKPSWLPDFGGEKKEEEPVAVAAEEGEEGEGEAAEEAAED